MEIAGRLLFIAAVTCYLLGRMFSGEATHPEILVYGATAAFGLEFLSASWRSLWAPSRQPELPFQPPGRCGTFGSLDARRTNALKASPRMFDSDLLDRLSRVHPMVPLAIFVPAIAVAFTVGARGEPTTVQVIGLVLAGYAFWTLTEYWMHRLIFHFEPEEGIGARLHWIIHGVHHDHPNDPLRLVMPPSVSIPLALAFWGLFVLVLGSPWANVFTAGFLGGYLMYDMLHYHVHHHRPRTRVGKLIRELHMRHHFQDDTKGFGVSAPFWDYVFGTPQSRSGRV